MWALVATPVATNTLTLPSGVERHAIIVQQDAYIMAHTTKRGIAVGGRLCDGTAGTDFLIYARRRSLFGDPFGNPFGSGFGGDPFGTSITVKAGSVVASDCPANDAAASCPSVVGSYATAACACHPSDYGSTNSRYSPWNCNLQSPVNAWSSSLDTLIWSGAVNRGVLPYDWSKFEHIAQQAMLGTVSQGGYTQHVIDQGGVYDRLSIVSTDARPIEQRRTQLPS